MIVSEFIEWLETQDQEAIVEVLVHSSGSGYYDQGGNVSVEQFDTSKDLYKDFGKHWEYTDFRGNQYTPEYAHYYNKRYLQIGSKDN